MLLVSGADLGEIHMPQQTKTKILIVGGGFGGVYTAMTLEKLLKGDPSVDVGLISKENYLVFQPMLPEVISGSIGILDTTAPIRRLCPKTNLYTREVESIDFTNRTVTTSSGVRPRPSQIEYDHLVIAVGNITSFVGRSGLAEHALPFKYLGDALVLRNRVIHSLEEADIESDPELRRALLTFVVAGGGFSGVEAVAELRDERVRTEFLEANRKAAAALTDYAAWLERDKLPKATADFALGQEKFQRLLKETELVDLPPEKVLETGLTQLRKEQKAFADAAKRIDSNKSAVEVFKQMQSEHPTPESLLADIGKDLEQIRKFVVTRKLVTIPSEVRARVKETPQYRRATSFASMDTPGAFEKRATEAYYYVTPPESDWPPLQKDEWLTAFNFYSTDVVSIHEVYPGHYVQFLRLNASPVSKVEKIFGSYAFIEGWAHYCEKMMVDEGYGTVAKPTEADEKRAAKYRLAQADEAMLRLCRLCVSIKMHTQQMTVEDAAKFFQDNCYYEEKPAHAEAMRGTIDPGYLNYTLGKLQILKLRDDYKAQEGANFSAQKFHNELLNHGMPPIRLLRELMLKDKSKWDEVL